MLLINFKVYRNSIGSRAVALAKAADKVAHETGAEIAVAVDATSISAVSGEVSIPVFAQHVDKAGFGAGTGHIIAEALKEAGASGAIINHAEKRLDSECIAGGISRCRAAGLRSVVCAGSIDEAAGFIGMHPDYISLEYAQLIGSGRSISVLMPKDVQRFSAMLNSSGCEIKPLCGAGVSSGADVKAALEMGAQGVIVSSAIVNAHDPEKVIREMAEAMGQYAVFARHIMSEHIA